MTGTLVFCTSYAETETIWTNRYRLWVNAIGGGEIQHDHLLLVDDASPVLPVWSDTRITNRLADTPHAKPITLYRFDKRLGRQGRTVYPGWYRSFCFAARFAETHGFTRVVHIESDGFIISRKMQHAINAVTDDWIAPAIQSHQMPESAVQVMAGRGLRSFFDFAKKPYSDNVGYEAENILPFTRIERQFVGSRYGETLHYVPREADFVTQTNPATQGDAAYYWWLRPDLLPFPADRDRTTMTSDTLSASASDYQSHFRIAHAEKTGETYEKDLGPELRHTGMGYLEFMEVLADALSPRTYFEIGTEAGHSLRSVRCDAVCVDPDFEISQNVFQGRRVAHFFQMASDDFFAHYDLRIYLSCGVDLAFLDGLHHYEVLLRDFINTERYCHERSLVLLHDCLPLNERMAERQQRLDENEDAETRHAWTGDVWKILPILRKYRPDLRIVQFDCGPTGLIGCSGLDPQSQVLSENYDKILREFDDVTLSQFGLSELWTQYPTIDTNKLAAKLEDFCSVVFVNKN